MEVGALLVGRITNNQPRKTFVNKGQENEGGGAMPAGQRKSTMRREIRTYIQRQIAQGVYRPGDRIVETQLAREMNVSQAPVREALLELAAMGLVEERPYSGTFVRHLKASDIEDIYNTRAFLDEMCIRDSPRPGPPGQNARCPWPACGRRCSWSRTGRCRSRGP